MSRRKSQYDEGFGECIRKLREALPRSAGKIVSQEEVAIRTGMATRTVQRAEKGFIPTPLYQQKFRSLFGKPFDNCLPDTVQKDSIVAEEHGLYGVTGKKTAESIYKDRGSTQVDGVDLGDLLTMTTAILTSTTEYSGSLAANIRSFYRSLELEKRTAKLESECGELRERVVALEEKLKLVTPQADPEESAA
jgi:transcriptional regulator with XRE-family HTH domain